MPYPFQRIVRDFYVTKLIGITRLVVENTIGNHALVYLMDFPNGATR